MFQDSIEASLVVLNCHRIDRLQVLVKKEKRCERYCDAILPLIEEAKFLDEEFHEAVGTTADSAVNVSTFK